ncbi:pyruvate kinase [Mycolicibacterium wolinskyi]|uniref:pyruvate kinase n=1 Tax=Mycolicibacterium wolinskyi TaxID=59750 RepID=UPI0039178789
MASDTNVDLDELQRDIDALLGRLDDAERQWASWIERTVPEHRRSAVNLAHYWAIRQSDLRDLQGRLAELGLSSLGRSEAHVQATLKLVSAALKSIAGASYVPPDDVVVRVGEGAELLMHNAAELLGPSPAERSVRIMVTLPSEAADDPQLIADLVDNGMNVARINCAHDDAAAWREMAAHVRKAGESCVIAMDLAGPKLRTGPLEPEDGALRLQRGDVLRVARDCSPAPVETDDPWIGCTLPEVFERAEKGERVLFDDGKLAGTIVEAKPDVLEVRIDHPALNSAKLKAGKGINVPDTELPISALTDKDIEDLGTVAEVADVVEFSFVRTADDIDKLFAELDRIGADHLGVVLKIETRPAFENLPQLVMAAMARRKVGVMIARGDLAVEVGYERMAELQEEMLWLCEAAHLPVIWATQVLEQLAKKGQPARSEVSDASMGVRAECVMLNKGPYIVDAVQTLAGILDRMEEHLYKKNTLLRTLRSWRPTTN